MAIDHRHRFLRHCVQSILILLVGIAPVLAFVSSSSSRRSQGIHTRAPMQQFPDSAQLLPSAEFSPPSPYANATEINSLVFKPKHEEDAEGVYAVAILQSSDKVDVAKLSKLLSKVEGSTYEKWELAPSYLVEDLCGFRPGSIPPFGYPTQPFRVIVDDSLTQLKADALLVGGGGSLDYRSLIRAEALVEAASAEVSSIIESRERFDGGMLKANENANEKQPYQRQFFQIAPPKGSLDITLQSDQPHRPIPVTAIGRVTSARRIAKRLVFADFAPPDYPMDPSFSSAEKQEEYEKDMPWLSGEDGLPMYVQMIVGKTFCDSLGEEEGPEALKTLKPGSLVLFRGAANVDPRQKNGWSNSAGNWAQKRSLDVIVSSFDVLSGPETTEDALKEHRKSLGILPWEQLKRRRSSGEPDASSKRSKIFPATPSEVGENGPILTLALFDSELQGSQTTILNVDTKDRVKEMANEFETLLSLSTSAEVDDDPLAFVLGIDCEWRPTGAFGSDDFDGNPVALLQISAPALRRIFLVDTFSLLRPGLQSEEAMTPDERILSDAIASIFGASSLLKTGFHVAIDFRRLAASYPHILGFREVHSVVELSTFAKRVHPGSSRNSLGSLQRLTRMALSFDLSKEQQCSDWEDRPLSREQIEYAALDCALPARLLDVMAEGAGRAKSESILLQSTSSWRFITVDSNDQNAITLLKAKRVVGNTFAVSQSWLAGKPAPEPPSMPTEDGIYVDKSGVKRMPSHLLNIHQACNGSGIVWNDMIGKNVGKTKGKCVELVADHALPEQTKLEYNPRSGFVPFKDGIVLFVNMPAPNQSRRSPYPNEWLDDGKILTWYLRERDWNDGQSETARLLGFGSSEKKASAVLFVRSVSGEFICCGTCSASAPESDLDILGNKRKNLVLLHINLTQWDQFKDSPEFVDMLRIAGDQSSTSGGEEEGVEEGALIDVATVTDSTSFQETLARMVIEGNVIDALGFALEASKTDPKKRSIVAGVGCLKNIFARSNDADVLKAVEILDDTAAQLGLF